MQEIPKQYDFLSSEEVTYKLWEASGFFNPDNIKSAKKYCNVLPPPNANGELHLGHASGYTVMDIFGRYERMNGKKVLLLPGKDHAGIQTQVVFEKKLKAEGGSREALGREKFYQACYDFCIDRANYMRSQERKIGISADWSREKFTLDPEVLKIALETFVQMDKDGMVYRGQRIINWCPSCATALSDVEVFHKEVGGKMYYIKYPIKDSKEFITVATTRPETMLGDTAVAVHPKDKRYLNNIGKTLILPLQNREISLIADRKIDMEFGTGAVKITPAHDPLDWEIGRQHKLAEIKVIDEKAHITAEGGKYQGQSVLVARENVLHDLAELGLLEKEEEIKINKSICERCKTTIEPLISKQWFINVDAPKYSLKQESLKAVRAGKVNIYPENIKKGMTHWLSNLNDWCVSRQIWWGPRIPVWYCDKCGEDKYIVSIEKPKKCPHCKGTDLHQDPDTFDTWFSSGQWAYTTLGFPKGKDAKMFYPSDMMVMGRDILFFWSARMIMLGLYRTRQIPFKNLYFTGLVRDKDGLKFSKSRGNGVDPLDMIEKFGADALRLSLVMDIGPGQDTRLYEEKIASFRNFITKLWNIFRYCVQADENFSLVRKVVKKDMPSLADRWIVSRLEETVREATGFMEGRNISLAQDRIKKFIWDDFANWYIEINKIEGNTKVLGYVLDKILRLQHPFAPFVTEKIFNIMNNGKELLMMSEWPKFEKRCIDDESLVEFRNLQELIVKIRNTRSNYRIDPQITIDVVGDRLTEKEIVEKLARVRVVVPTDRKKKMLEIASHKHGVKLDISELIDVQKELARFKKEEAEMEGLVRKTSGLLANKNFVQGADKEVVDGAKRRLAQYQEKLKVQKGIIGNLEKL
jgi:valyl-tRNA synthetase